MLNVNAVLVEGRGEKSISTIQNSKLKNYLPFNFFLYNGQDLWNSDSYKQGVKENPPKSQMLLK